MLYKNRKTGQVVRTTGRVCGENWELVDKAKPDAPDAPKKPVEAPKKSTGKKKAGGPA